MFSIPEKKMQIRDNANFFFFFLSAAMPAVTSCISSSSIHVMFEKRFQQTSPPLPQLADFDVGQRSRYSDSHLKSELAKVDD